MSIIDDPNDIIIQNSFQDIIEDFNEQTHIARSFIRKICTYRNLLDKIVKKSKPKIHHILETQIESLELQFRTVIRDIAQVITDIQANGRTEQMLHTCMKEKSDIAHTLRTIMSFYASIRTASDWQSPTFAHSLTPLAGVQTGRIQATINDYKRDLHIDAYELENQFKKEYIDARFKPFIQVYATSSGMAAITTILWYLIYEYKVNGPVIIGKSTYFEAKILLLQAFPDAIEVDEMETESIVSLIKDKYPQLIWLDSLTNTEDVAVPNIQTIISAIGKFGEKDTVFVLDNSCLSVTCQPLRKTFFRLKNIHFVGIESLNKYYQFGTDRTTGGIMWSLGRNAGKLSDYRVHLGTNIPDITAHMIIEPDRKRLVKRLGRFERNAIFVATKLSEYIKVNSKTCIEQINYPGLPEYKNYSCTKNIPFHGSFLTFRFKKQYQNINFYKRFVSKVLREAKKINVQIVSGTSFGMDTTRIYLTAIRATETTPFVRLSIGTETLYEIEKIISILTNVM